jgi:hypothetical protein
MKHLLMLLAVVFLGTIVNAETQQNVSGNCVCGVSSDANRSGAATFRLEKTYVNRRTGAIETSFIANFEQLVYGQAGFDYAMGLCEKAKTELSVCK